ncbi:MAG: multidrug effflux MFS transporter [Campylobacteraceae bacterium]|jgi:DHA1 family bicyclomycin/chloramphenicol resistance-like MFS transporter|nr:multidrug effflux MFS transporter [Campylobacteraceae bacterium]
MNVISERRLVFILAALSAITPLAIDMYLPAISNMSKAIGVDESMVSVSISIFFLGLAAGQLFGGPISDAYGRKPMVIAGLALFCISSFVIVFVDNVYVLWFFRFIQAFGGGVATVNVSATVRDMFSGKDSARIFSMIGSITILAPLIAPPLGLGVILIFKRWETIFLILGIYSLLALYFYKRNVIISPKTEKVKITPIRNYIDILTSSKPMILIIALVVSSSGMYAVLTFSSVMYEKYLGLSKPMFILCFSMNIASLMIASRINMRLVRRISPLRLLKFGMKAQVLISIILFSFYSSTNPYIIAPLIALFIGTLGFVFGNALSIVLDYFPKISGSANAVIGVLQYSVGAFAGFLVGLLNDGSLFPLMCVIMCSSIIGAAILLISVARSKVLA